MYFVVRDLTMLIEDNERIVYINTDYSLFPVDY